MTIRTLVATLALAGAALSALPASAQTATTPLQKGETVATLSSPLKRPFDDVIDGRMWHCADASCHAAATATMSGQSLGRECGNASRRLGAFASYQTGATALEGDKLAACNSGAKKS